MAWTVDGIAVGVATELPNFFNDTIDAIYQGEGEYLRSGEPQSVISKIGQAVGRGYCRAYGALPDSVQTTVAPRVEKACRPYLSDLGFSSGPKITQDFTGGQCATTYLVRGDAINPSTGALLGNFPYGFFVGPLSIERESEPECSPGQVSVPRTVLVHAGGRFELVAAQCAAFNPLGPIQVIRDDGLPDDCGNPVPVVEPPPPIVPPPSNPFRFNPSADIDIDIDVRIGPDGDIVFNIGTGDITVDPFPDGGGGGGGDGGPPPGDVGEPGAPVDTGDGGDVDGEAPPGAVLTGLRIDFNAPPVGGNEYKEGIYRGVCYVYMGTSEGVDHDPAGSMLRDGQFIFAEKDNLTHWFVSANRGYNLRVTPYYRPVEVEE